MDASAFLAHKPVPQPTTREIFYAVLNTIAGLVLIFGFARFTTGGPAWVTGWVGLLGLALFLLFGIARLLSIAWRRAGVDAQPIMNGPLRARSLTEFWGARWNLAFHDVGRLFIFYPLRKRIGGRLATVAVFLFSGIVHDLVMSVPVRAGFGLPTLYFLLQAGGVFLERSRLGKRMGLGRGVLGRVYAAAFVLVPVALLFHAPFLRGVIVPTLEWLGAIS